MPTVAGLRLDGTGFERGTPSLLSCLRKSLSATNHVLPTVGSKLSAAKVKQRCSDQGRCPPGRIDRTLAKASSQVGSHDTTLENTMG